MQATQAVVRAFEASQQEVGITGRLLGLDLPARDALHAAFAARFEADVEAARTEARRTGLAVAVDGAGLSLTEGPDTWHAHPDGRLSRTLGTFPGFAGCLRAAGEEGPAASSGEVPLDRVLALLYLAFWAPSATNWQPTRVLISRSGPLHDALGRLSGRSGHDGPRLLLLRRDHYESLLGDVLEPFGLAVTAREESIDAGIFAHTLRLGARAAGLACHECVLDEEASTALREPLLEDLALRRGASGLLGGEVARLEGLARDVEAGRYLPDAVVDLAWPVDPCPTFEGFQALVGAYGTQRVAAPGREVSAEALQRLWAAALESLPPPERTHVACVAFSWHDRTPARIGAAMFEALYGRGADPASRAGGEGGLLTGVTVRAWLQGQPAAALPAGWETFSDEELRRAAGATAVRAETLGPHLRDRLLRDGKYRVVEGELRDERDRPLSVAVLVRLLKALASTFGQHFLRFQNTHPRNAIVLASPRSGSPHRAWRAVGRVAAALTYAARAEGLSSIVKTGPIDLAREAIHAVLVENPDGDPYLETLHEDLAGGLWSPALTFQVGHALADEPVEDGTASPHGGVEERRRDRRPPRAPFSHHVWAPPEWGRGPGS